MIDAAVGLARLNPKDELVLDTGAAGQPLPNAILGLSTPPPSGLGGN